MSNVEPISAPAPVDMTIDGDFPGAAEYARTKIGGLTRLTRHPISHVRVRLTRRHNPAVANTVLAQANLTVRGRPVRAQVEAGHAHEAIDQLEARLRRAIERVVALWEPHRGPDVAPPWRDAAEPIRASRHPDTDGAPSISRRKTFAMAPCTVDDAIREMELLDYDFHLFNEIATGAAAVVYRSGATDIRLALVDPALADALAPYERPITISPHRVPCLRQEAAVERMDLMKLPFLFYIDAAEGRASVLYRRYDGDLAVLTPAG
ncbi:HPF/RaiA family ribosome-associated protein [Mycobacterium sp. MBM]|nr:HPF/RaiA family ribosome-associated protein [Mycobacterium sp. MBM]